jgi:Mrp family chromosome partitioning ATPase
MSQVRYGALIALIVLAVFAAYAFLAPATYRTSALVLVDQASPATSANLPEPLEAARRLSEAILDRKTLERLSRERAGSAGQDAQAQASSGVRRGLEIDTSDAHAFSISYRDTDQARTQSACNVLAKHAVELAPLVLVDHGAERAIDLKRQEQTQELASFLALHPQVASEPPPVGDKSPDHDAALSALNAEKANLEHRIGELESGVTSDNPYVDPRESDPKLLHRRLTEINTALSARRQALDAKPSGTELPPEVRAEWKRLLEAVTQTSSDAQTQVRPALVARLASQAVLPSSPIEPNRRLLLFFGVVFGVGLGAAFSLALRAAQQRRTKSSRPPMPIPSQGALTVYLPSAPPLPSDVGPPVPVSARPAPNLGPAIVPVPQRPISSSPPGPEWQNKGNHPSSNPPPQQDTRLLAEGRSSTSSRPPRRFASTLVLPPSENPTPQHEEVTPDPVLASAARAWDQQIRAHDVPGFAVVKPGSEPPPALETPDAPASMYSVRPPSGASPVVTTQHATARPPNQMKVTQPLGSFLPDAAWKESVESVRRAQATPSPVPPRNPPEAADSKYSYVSTSPPPSSSSKNVVLVQEVPKTWRPDPVLTPGAQRALCEQLYPYAVESCFVLSVVAVPESVGYKSRVAAELALGLAESGHPRILLLEGDLHRPWVQRMIGVDMPISTGFSQQLNARAQGTGNSRWTVLGVSRSLHVLAEGMMRSPGLLLSKQFADCVSDLRTYYDFIVIDGPTSSLDVDSGALDAVTDGIVTVCPAKGSQSIAHMQGLFARKRFSAFATAPDR